MVLLFRKLQVQNACLYKLQQPLLLHKYKDPELQIGPLGLKVLNTIFKLTTIRAKQMQLEMPCQGFRRETRMRKISSKLRMAESFIVCRIH